MLTRVVVAFVLATTLTLTGCQGDDPPESAPSSVDAFPDPPHVSGPVTVRLRPALALMNGDRRCRPDAGVICSADGSGGYRALGNSRPLVVDEVSTAQSTDHTSWQTTVGFAEDAADAVRRTRGLAAGFGGVVAVTVDGMVVMVAVPAEIGPRRILRLGLEKAEAWRLVDAFSRSK